MPFKNKLCKTLLAFRTKITDDRAISLFCLISLMVRRYVSHQTWVRITIPSFPASNPSRIFSMSSLPFLMSHMRATLCVFGLSQDTFSSRSTAPLSTVLASVKMMLLYSRAISALAFAWVIAGITPLVFRFAFSILMLAGAFWWKSTQLIVDVISFFIWLESSTLSSVLDVRRRSASLDPAVRQGLWPGPGTMCALWLLALGGTFSCRLVGVGADFGLGVGCNLGCILSCSLCFGCCCSCYHFSGPSSCFASACWEDSSPQPPVLPVISLSFPHPSWPVATPFMLFMIVFMKPAPHSLSSSQWESNAYSLWHTQHHSQHLCLLAGCPGYHQVCMMSNSLVHLC